MRTAIVALALASCTLPDGRGELEATVVSTPLAGTSWTDDDGNAVTLEAGSLVLENLYLHEPGSPSVASVFDLVVPVAHAHPGHDESGDVAGELLGTWTIDLSAGELELGKALVFEGDLETATLGLGDEHVVLRGTVDTGDAVRDFSFAVHPDQDVTGLPFDARFTMADAPTVRVGIDAAWMLSFVDWSAPDTDGDGVLTERDGDVGALVLFGVHSTGTYSVEVIDDL